MYGKVFMTKLLMAMGIILISTMPASASYTIDFEGLDEYTAVTDQYSDLGITFNGATVLTAETSLNEIDYPPYSGTNVVIDETGPITISFDTVVQSVHAYFTYAVALTLSFYDSSDALIDTIYSSGESNLEYDGGTPNELLGLTTDSGIASLTISGAEDGYSFVMDDLRVNPVPVPGAVWLLGSGLVGLIGIVRGKNSKAL